MGYRYYEDDLESLGVSAPGESVTQLMREEKKEEVRRSCTATPSGDDYAEIEGLPVGQGVSTDADAQKAIYQPVCNKCT